MDTWLLPILIFLPLLGAGVIVLAPTRSSYVIALWTTLIAMAIGVGAIAGFDWSDAGAFQGELSVPWVPALGLEFSLGVDSVALLLILLTLLLGPICVAASRTAITERIKTYFALLLVLQAAMTGVFAARDLAFFYICFEFTLIPMYVLISLYGSSNRKYAATKFFLYTFTGSIIALAGLIYVVYINATSAFGSGEWTFDIATLQATAVQMSPNQQGWVLLAMLLGFAVKVPLFPFHTWLPLAHTEAPTAGSVILAGVLLKLGTYGIYRFCLGFTPGAIVEYAGVIAILSIIGILYAGLICWVQQDVKKLIAYSSVSHLGFCILGLVALNSIGVAGSVLYMVNHGLSTGALFLLIGMMYERYHTRDMEQLGGLAKKMPVWSTFMVFFVLASVGLPGLNGFVSEVMCLIGTFQSDALEQRAGLGATPGRLGPWYAAIAGLGMIVAAMYLLIMLGKIVWGRLREPKDHHLHAVLPTDLDAREITLLAPLAILCVALGLFPTPILKAIEAPVNDTVEWVWTQSGNADVLASAPGDDVEIAAREGDE